MRYTFKCGRCGESEVKDLPMAQYRSRPRCACGARMARDLLADWKTVQVDTSACKDHSEVRADKRVRSAWDGGRSPDAVEAQFKRQITTRRKEIRDSGGQNGTIKQTHSVPAHLYHGKIKESGDKNYWSDSKNLNRHTECKVDG